MSISACSSDVSDKSAAVDSDEAGAANVNVLVRINNHFYRQGGTGLA